MYIGENESTTNVKKNLRSKDTQIQANKRMDGQPQESCTNDTCITTWNNHMNVRECTHFSHYN